MARYERNRDQRAVDIITRVSPVAWQNPNLNGNYSFQLDALNLTDNTLMRFAGAKVMARPNFEQLSPTFVFAGDFVTATKGNPSLDPFRATQFNIAFEHYFGEGDLKQFRIITGIAAIFALTIPVLGFNPVKGQILTQVLNVFVLPLVIFGIIFMVNNKKLMGSYAAGYLLNLVLGLAFLFSLMISFNGILALTGQ